LFVARNRTMHCNAISSCQPAATSILLMVAGHEQCKQHYGDIEQYLVLYFFSGSRCNLPLSSLFCAYNGSLHTRKIVGGGVAPLAGIAIVLFACESLVLFSGVNFSSSIASDPAGAPLSFLNTVGRLAFVVTRQFCTPHMQSRPVQSYVYSGADLSGCVMM